MCKIEKTPVDIDTGSRVKLASPQVIITLSISYNNDASTIFNGLSYHQRKYRQLHRNQRPSKAFTNSPSGIHGLNRLQKLSNKRYNETRITQHLALIFHSHICLSKDKIRVKKCGTVQTACPFPHCGTMKDVLIHMTSCELKFCPFPHCYSSRRIIVHWKSCTRSDCSICKPFRKPSD